MFIHFIRVNKTPFMYIDRILPFTTFISRNKHNKKHFVWLRLYWLRLRCKSLMMSLILTPFSIPCACNSFQRKIVSKVGSLFFCGEALCIFGCFDPRRFSVCNPICPRLTMMNKRMSSVNSVQYCSYANLYIFWLISRTVRTHFLIALK